MGFTLPSVINGGKIIKKKRNKVGFTKDRRLRHRRRENPKTERTLTTRFIIRNVHAPYAKYFFIFSFFFCPPLKGSIYTSGSRPGRRGRNYCFPVSWHAKSTIFFFVFRHSFISSAGHFFFFISRNCKFHYRNSLRAISTYGAVFVPKSVLSR